MFYGHTEQDEEEPFCFLNFTDSKPVFKVQLQKEADCEEPIGPYDANLFHGIQHNATTHKHSEL